MENQKPYKHGQSPKAVALREFAPDSLMGLMYSFGHRFHHVGPEKMTEDDFFSALDPQEKAELARLLLKAKEGWNK